MKGSILGKFAVATFLVALVDLGFLNWWVVKKDKELSTQQAVQVREVEQEELKNGNDDQENEDIKVESSPSPEVGTEAKEDLKVSNSTKVEPVVQTAQKEIFIPLGSSTTKSGIYVDLWGLEVTIDPSKYTAIDSIYFEAALSVDGGNGRAWAQLYVVDDKNPLIESQISNPTSTPTLKSSGKIPIPTSSKTFRVQAKTELTDYTANVNNTRIKITLK